MVCRVHVAWILLAQMAAPGPTALARAQDEATGRTTAWREDLAHLVAEIPKLHPDPFHGVDRATFAAAVQQLDAELARCDDAQATVGFMRLLALLGSKGREGHSGVFSRAFTHLPLRLYEFPDGVFVVAAHPDHADLVGARVLGIDGHDIAAVLAAVDPLVARDCEQDARSKRPGLARIPQVLHALGLAAKPDRARLRLRRGDRGGPADGEADVELTGLPWAEHRAWPGSLGSSLPPADAPRHLAHRDEAFRLDWLAEAHTVYVQYHAVAARTASGTSIADFARQLAATVAEHDAPAPAAAATRVVIDLRHNGGGDNTTYAPLLAMLRDDARLHREHGLYLLIGPGTFSAASNFVTEVERTLEHALLVGEATGGSPNQYGDARAVELPNHRELVVRIATRYHEKAPGDPRLSHEPDLPVPFGAADYFAGRDPVLDAALRHTR